MILYWMDADSKVCAVSKEYCKNGNCPMWKWANGHNGEKVIYGYEKYEITIEPRMLGYCGLIEHKDKDAFEPFQGGRSPGHFIPYDK